ncbi:hypothetical protein AAFN60_11105 [Roseibacillus persicicus]|uniref:hypothetical protein n=1 Tax=Roseibacillus persicicus TaxID=454148 RepID=UPI00398AA1A6
MNSPLLLLTLLGAASIAAETEPALDFLRFTNGDTLHGHYLGLDEGPLVQWQSTESPDQSAYRTENLRKLSLNNGRAKEQITSSGMVELSNGDLVPGDLIAMGSDSVSVQTQFAGLLTIPRKHVRIIMPNRHGGNVIYAGPLNDLDWSIPGADPEAEEAEEAGDEQGDEDKKKVTLPETWTHGGGAWSSNSSDILRLDKELPDRVSIRFHLTWQAPLNTNIAIFTDFQKPFRQENVRVRRVPDGNKQKNEKEEEAEAIEEDAEGEEEEPAPEMLDIMEVGPGNSDSESYGSGYLMSILSSYSRLQRLSFDDKKMPRKSSFPNSGGRLNLGDFYSAEFEIRANREEGTVALFVNGEFYSEWQDLATPLEETSRYFAIAAGSKSRIRISDVVVAKWNGMPDSARSMETEERDVILLTNGTDRLSGDLLTLEEDRFRIESKYGEFQIPAQEITDIRLATNSIVEGPEPQSGEILVNMQPKGLLTFLPKEGNGSRLKGSHPILGDLTLDLNYAYLLEFDPISSIFDNWDDDF